MYKFFRTAFPLFVIAAAIVGGLVLFTNVSVGKIERAHPPSGRFVEVEGGRIHLVELGAANAPPVVLLHGAGTNLGDMRLALGDRLAATHRVVLIDRPGHGWSERQGGTADASPARQAKLIHQALTQIGVIRPVLVAHSWSGALATAYALAFPDDVAGLVLLAPMARAWVNSVAWHDSFVKAMLAEGTRLAAVPRIGPLVASTLSLPLGKMLIEPSVRSAFAPQEPPPDYLTRTGAELLLRPSEFSANAQDIEQLDSYLAAHAQAYRAIKVPTVILTGDRDEVLSADTQAGSIATMLPHAKLVVLPGVGHMVHFAAPDRVIDAISEIDKADSQHTGEAQCATLPSVACPR